jgi:predicted nucleotidyltransferase
VTTRDLPFALRAFFDAHAVPGLVSAYVFGSHATGRAHRESDIDVAVLLDRDVFPTPQRRFEARLGLIGTLGPELGVRDLDLVVLNDAPPHLVRRAMTDGVQVACTDAKADHAARRTALLRAPDLDVFLRRMRRLKLRAIAR